MAEFANRVELREEWYQLVGSLSTDAELTAQGEDTNQIANRCLQYGCWNAQQYLIELGGGDRWYKVGSALSWTTSDAQGWYASAPSDLLRLAADEQTSGLREADGTGWGRLIQPAQRFNVTGNYYYLLDIAGAERIWLTLQASPPATLYPHYYYRHPALADGTEPDMDELDRPLIVAEAAVIGMRASWFTGDPQRRQDITENLRYWRDQARLRIRRSRQPRRIRTVRGFGSHHFM